MLSWLKKLRMERKMTQQDVARLIGITSQYYCYIENGTRRPSPEVAIKIAGVLGFKNWYSLLVSSDESPREVFQGVG